MLSIDGKIAHGHRSSTNSLSTSRWWRSIGDSNWRLNLEIDRSKLFGGDPKSRQPIRSLGRSVGRSPLVCTSEKVSENLFNDSHELTNWIITKLSGLFALNRGSCFSIWRASLKSFESKLFDKQIKFIFLSNQKGFQHLMTQLNCWKTMTLDWRDLRALREIFSACFLKAADLVSQV